MSAPTEKELIAIKKFREMVSDLKLTDEEKTDMSLVAWIRARDMDLQKAYEMLKTCLQWRIEHDIANISSWEPPAEYWTKFPYIVSGAADADGCPVCVLPYGIWDVRSIIESGKKEVWLKYTDKLFALLFDSIRENSVKLNKTVTQFNVIFDFTGFSMKQLTSFSSVDSVLEVVRRFEANYPETLKAAIVVNAPMIFNILFSLVKPLLSKRTLGKVEIYGCNEGKWKAHLLKHIPPQSLPVAYGGTSTELMKSLDQLKIVSNDNEELLTVHIKAGSKFELEYDITHPNTILRWIFKTDNYDIGFSIVFNDKTEVFKYNRYNAHVEVQRGSITCEKLGKYMIVFDNSFSRMTKKTLHYLVTNSLPVDIED